MRVGPKSRESLLKEEGMHRHRGHRRPCEDRPRAWGYAAVSQGGESPGSEEVLLIPEVWASGL